MELKSYKQHQAVPRLNASGTELILVLLLLRIF